MIKIVDGERQYFDKNGNEITEGCEIRYPHGDRSLERVERVHKTEDGQLGTDATNPHWIETGRAVPCEYGIYPLTREETEMVEVVSPIQDKNRSFDFYKNRLVNECGDWGRFRFNAIEYMCSFPGIDPLEMAVALKKDGFGIVFDDSSISHADNMRKMKMFERRFAEETKDSSVDNLISVATAAAKEANQAKESIEQDYERE